MSSLDVNFSYDRDAGAGSEARASRPQSMKTASTIDVGDGIGGEFDDDTAGAVTGITATAARKNVPGRPKAVAGPRGSKTIHPKAGSQAITKNAKSGTKPTSASSSVQDFFDASSCANVTVGPQKSTKAQSSAHVQSMDPRSFQHESKATGSSMPMQTMNDSQANTGSVANATLRIVKHGSERYDPVGKSDAHRTTLFSTPPPKGSAVRQHFASGEELRNTQPIAGNTLNVAQVFNISTADCDRTRLEEEREKWRQVSFAWAQKLMEGLGERAEDYRHRLQMAWEDAVFEKQCQTEEEMYNLMLQCKAIFGEQEEQNKI